MNGLNGETDLGPTCPKSGCTLS